jgi:hypothetical protein
MFRFTIRDLLWLMVVVGMGCGWWLDNRDASYDRQRIKKYQRDIKKVLQANERAWSALKQYAKNSRELENRQSETNKP